MDRLTIGIVGFGIIGQRWAAWFAHAGHDVRVYDPAEDQEAVLHEVLPALAADLDSLKGPASSAWAAPPMASVAVAANHESLRVFIDLSP